MLERRGGVTKMMAVVQATQSAFQQIISLPASSAEPSSAPSQGSGYPVAPGFDLTSSEQSLALPASYIDTLNAIGAGSDDVPWVATQTGQTTFSLSTVNVNTGAVTVVASTPIPVISIAAIDANEAYAVEGGEGADNVMINVDNGTVTTLPALPNGDYPNQVAASPDGTVWALAESGNIYSYATSTQNWSSISTDGYTIQEVTVGSSSNIWALTKSDAALQYSAANGFQPDPVITGGTTAIQATSDGAVWIDAYGNLWMKPSGGTWEEAPAAAQPPKGLTWLGLAAGSMNRAYTFGYTTVNNQPDLQVDLMQIGIVDRQPTPLPAFTGEYETAYLDLSASATDNNPGGVRALYDTPGISWSTIQLDVDETPEPAGFSDTIWQSVKNELDTELTDVAAVYNRIDEIETIDTADPVNQRRRAQRGGGGRGFGGPGARRDHEYPPGPAGPLRGGRRGGRRYRPIARRSGHRLAVGLRTDRRNLLLRYGRKHHP